MKRILHIVLYFTFGVLYVTAQVNLNKDELNLIKKSLSKSYELKEASKSLSLDSLERKIIKQNFIPTLALDALYGYGMSRMTVDIPVYQLPITGIQLFEGSKEFNAKANIFNANLTAKALLFSGLQVTYGSKAFTKKIKAKNFMLKAKKAEVIKEVISVFNNIELLHKAILVIDSSEKRLSAEKKRVIVAIKNGLAIPYDRDKITAAELNLLAKKAAINGNISLLYLKLSMLTDVEISTLEKYKFDLEPWIIKNNSNAFTDRPELKALEASIEAHDYKLKMNKTSFLPKIQAFASLSYANLFNAELETPYTSLISGNQIKLEINKLEAFPTYFFGVGMHWDLFTGLKNSNKTKKAIIEKTIAEDKKDDVAEKLALFAKKAQIDFVVKNQQLQFKKQEKQVAYNTLNLASKAYHEKLISITDRLKAEFDYQEAEFNYYKLVSQQRLSAIDVLMSTGRLNIINLTN